MRSRILLAMGSLVLCLVIAEALLRLLAPQVHRLPDVWTHHARLGWTHRPESTGRLVAPEFDVTYRIDAAGHRQHESDRGTDLRIQLYGDSFAEAWGIEVEDGLAARLEAELKTALGVSVTNFGTAGYGTDQELLLFSDTGAQLSPDVVLLLFYANDLWNNVSPRGIGVRRGAKPYFRLGRGPELPGSGALQLMGTPIPEPPPRPSSLSFTLQQYCHLWALGFRALTRQAPIPQAGMQDFYGGLYGRDTAHYRPVWELTERLLAEFARRCEQRGAAFVVVYAPAIVQIEADYWRTKRDLHQLTKDYDLNNPNRQLQGIAGRQGIPLIDLTPAFAAAAEQQTLYFRDSHWNEVGHRLAAETIAAALTNLGVVAEALRDD